MSKFRQVARGKRAIRRVPLPLVNLPCPLLPDMPELAEQRQKDREAWESARATQPGQAPPLAPDQTVEVGLRVLTGAETAWVLQKANEWATERGVKDLVVSNPLYSLGYMAHLCLVACVDPDAKDFDAPEAQFFDSVDEILSSPHIGRDGLVFLAECQETWQDMCSPQALKIGTADVWRFVEEVATSDDPLAFDRLRPGMRYRLVRSMANLLLSSQTFKFSSGSDSTTNSGNSSTPQPSADG